jgi:hypothetical protein
MACRVKLLKGFLASGERQALVERLRTAHKRCNSIRGRREEGGRLDCKALIMSIPLLRNISPPLLLRLNVHHPVSAWLISVFQELAVSVPKPRTALLVDESAR